uniref:G_PROTEIN_RECEP_F2_3 domain-containing protein n=1 Tax=Heterorhabditis bacteriophora TaxID=37862 RepID=A0A1I7XS77_HETBA
MSMEQEPIPCAEDLSEADTCDTLRCPSGTRNTSLDDCGKQYLNGVLVHNPLPQFAHGVDKLREVLNNYWYKHTQSLFLPVTVVDMQYQIISMVNMNTACNKPQIRNHHSLVHDIHQFVYPNLSNRMLSYLGLKETTNQLAAIQQLTKDDGMYRHMHRYNPRHSG